MKIGKAFPSNYIKSDDLDGRRVVVTIDRVELEKIGDDEKPVLYFKGKDRGLVLNKTNAATIVEITGSDDTDDWHGHPIVLFPSKTEFQGKRVPCIRVDDPPKNGNQRQAGRKTAAPAASEFVDEEAAEMVGHGADADDEPPF